MTRALFSVALLAACGGSPVDPALFAATPTWSNDIRPILARSCTPCHTADGLRAGGVELDTYAPLYSARVKNVCVAISTDLVALFEGDLHPIGPDEKLEACHGWEIGSMPTGALSPLTEGEQVLFARWLQIGAPQ